jgi:hypothetical protein
MSVIESK